MKSFCNHFVTHMCGHYVTWMRSQFLTCMRSHLMRRMCCSILCDMRVIYLSYVVESSPHLFVEKKSHNHFTLSSYFVIFTLRAEIRVKVKWSKVRFRIIVYTRESIAIKNFLIETNEWITNVQTPVTSFILFNANKHWNSRINIFPLQHE